MCISTDIQCEGTMPDALLTDHPWQRFQTPEKFRIHCGLSQSISASGETDPSRGWALHIPIFRYFNMLCDSGCFVSARCETWSIAVWVLFWRTQPIRKRKNVWAFLSPRNPLASNLNRTSRLLCPDLLAKYSVLCTLEVIYSLEEYIRI